MKNYYKFSLALLVKIKSVKYVILNELLILICITYCLSSNKDIIATNLGFFYFNYSSIYY